MANVKRALTSGITKTGTAVADVPDAPTIGTATAAGLSASVTFTAAATGGTPTSYTVTSSPGGFTGTGASAPITVSGLSDGTSYTFTVTATNAAGTSGASSSSNSITAVAPLEGAYDALYSTTLTGNTSSIVIQGIPSTYKHLQLRMLTRDTNANTNINSLYCYFNSDTSAIYAWNRIEGLGSSTGVRGGLGAQGSIWIGPNVTNAYTSNIFAAHIIDILDYSDVRKNTTVRHLGGFDTNGTGTEPGEIAITGGLWTNSSAVTSITIVKSGDNQVANSHFALYGIK